jgi:hypothetical protein
MVMFVVTALVVLLLDLFVLFILCIIMASCMHLIHVFIK